MLEYMDFKTRLATSVAQNNSLVCVGLDSELSKLPSKFKSSKEPMYEFNCAIIDATANLVCAYKANSAFYEAEGPSGIEQLQKTVAYIHDKYPGIPVILDAKRADIGNTNTGYTKFIFEYLNVDAVTVHPYLGHEAIEPFLEYKDRGIIVLCRTSNSGAAEFQDLEANGQRLYQTVAQNVHDKWNVNNNCLLVVGATYPKEMKEIREMVGDDMTFLVPGVGAQGGDIEATVRAGVNNYGDGMIINSSRGIIFASDGDDFAEAARVETEKLRGEINKYRHTDLVLALHRIGAIKFGEYTLKSGIISPIYLDLRILVSYPDELKQVAKAYSGLLRSVSYDRMAALPYAALPLVAATSSENNQPWIYTRKEAKDYGTKKLIEGEYNPGETIVVVDDMTTNGASKLEVIAPFEKEGLKVKDVVVLLDRQQGASKILSKKGYKLHAVLTFDVVLDTLLREGMIDQAMCDSVKSFLAANQAK